LHKRFAQDHDVGVVFVFFNYKEPHSAGEILGSLLKQLVLQKTTISKGIRDAWETHKKRDTRPTILEFLTLLQNESKNFTKLFVVMDALDECPETHENRDCRDKLLTDVRELGPVVRLLVTGRPHIKNVTEIFPDAAHIRIRASDDDIRKYVNGRIDMEGKLRFYIGKNPKLRKRVASKIAKKVEGM
jgi:ankyrin repeat domain-containing protein 50